MPRERPSVEIKPATKARWADLEQVFGRNGAYGGCWCMFFRLTGREFEACAGEPNKAALHELVTGGEPAPGLLAYADGDPVGWCAVAPRAEYPRILRSPINKPAPDDDPADPTIWSVTCFYVRRSHRRTGVSTALLTGAVDFAVEHGARVVEGYPTDVRTGPAHPLSLFTGTPALFRAAGFTEYLSRSERRSIMRYLVG